MAKIWAQISCWWTFQQKMASDSGFSFGFHSSQWNQLGSADSCGPPNSLAAIEVTSSWKVWVLGKGPKREVSWNRGHPLFIIRNFTGVFSIIRHLNHLFWGPPFMEPPLNKSLTWNSRSVENFRQLVWRNQNLSPGSREGGRVSCDHVCVFEVWR